MGVGLWSEVVRVAELMSGQLTIPYPKVTLAAIFHFDDVSLLVGMCV